MAFYINKDDLENKCYKIKGTIPIKTLEILQEDGFQFDENRFQTYCTRIFLKYYEQALASISIRVNEKRNILLKNAKNLGLSSNDIKVFIDELLNQYKADLEKRKEYDSTEILVTKQMDIRGNILDIITSIDSLGYDSLENPNPTPTKYFFAVINEYANLPLVKREQIFYKDEINAFRNAIRDERWCKFKLKGHKSFLTFSPYKISLGTNNQYTYIIGNLDNDKKISYRISSIDFLTFSILESKCKRTKAEKEAFDKEIKTKSIEFISSDIIEAKVKLDNNGMKIFKKISTNRPNFKKDKFPNNVVTFEASLTQIQFYLKYLGDTYQILEPKELKDSIKEMANNIIKNNS